MMVNEEVQRAVCAMLRTLYPLLNERDRRLLLGTAASVLGRGGNALACSITGASKNTVSAGSREILAGPTADVLRQYMEDTPPDHRDTAGANLAGETKQAHTDDIQTSAPPNLQISAPPEQPENAPVQHPDVPAPEAGTPLPPGRIRRPGAGRKPALQKNPDLPDKLTALILRSAEQVPTKPYPLYYTVLSTRTLSRLLAEDPEHPIATSHHLLSRTLEGMGYRNLNGRKQVLANRPCPDRSAQFQQICDTAMTFLDAGEPILSIGMVPPDASSPAPSAGVPSNRIWHNLSTKQLGIPLIYEIQTESGSIPWSCNYNTAPPISFIAAAVRLWLTHIGLPTFPAAKRIFITLDAGIPEAAACGTLSDALQEIANQAGLEIHLSLLPPAIYRWGSTAHSLTYRLPEPLPGGFTELSLRLVGSGIAVQFQEDQSFWRQGYDNIKGKLFPFKTEYPTVPWQGIGWNEIFLPRPDRVRTE